MAKINSMGVGKARGSMGNVTYRTVGGETIGSQKVDKGTQLVGTLAQVRRRVRLANVVHAYRALQLAGGGNGLYMGFPERNPRVSVFNAFVSANLPLTEVGNVAMTKEEAASDLVLPAPFVVSRGRLPEARLAASQAVAAGGFFQPSDWVGAANNVTALEFLSAVFKEDFGCQAGDTVTFFSMQWNPSNLSAGVKFGADQFVVDGDASQDLSWVDTIVGTGGAPGSFRLDLSGNGMPYAFTIVIGRRNGGQYVVSNSQFAASDLSGSGYDAAVADSKMAAAVASYGYRLDPYLQQNP